MRISTPALLLTKTERVWALLRLDVACGVDGGDDFRHGDWEIGNQGTGIGIGTGRP